MERSGSSSASSPQGSSPIRQGSSPTRKEFDKEDPSQPAASSPKKCVEDSTPALLADLLPSTHAFVIPTAADLLTGVPLPTSSAVQPSSDSPHLKIIELDNEDAKLDPNENANTDKSEVLPFNDNESTRGMLAKTPTINYSEHFFLAEMEHYHESSQKGYHKPPQHNTKLSQRDTEELLRSDLAAATVRHRRLEEEVRETRAQLSQRGLQATELTRQLDAHRQEHARQAATIISLRSRLQEAEDTVARLQVNLQRSELSVAALSRDNKRQSERITELEERLSLKDEPRAGCSKQFNSDQLQAAIDENPTCTTRELSKTFNLEEREGAEQRGELSQKRLGELVASLTSMLGIPRASSSNHLLTDTILQKLSNLLKEASSLRRDKAELEENLQQRVAVADGARQTVGRLVGQLDEERRNVVLLRDNIETLGKSEEELRTRLRTSEEEVVSLRERVHSTSSSYGRTLEDLHATEAKLQKARDECLVVEHRRQQAEVEWKGVLNTIASLLSTSSTGAHEGVMVEANPPDIVQALQTRVAVTRETYEVVHWI
ncbi:hypothetical protein FHG87_000633 [Trinorchestia longiramus]|nr:hypothetical protein FHG87_000633 [Trinorchestia longiramus]